MTRAESFNKMTEEVKNITARITCEYWQEEKTALNELIWTLSYYRDSVDQIKKGYYWEKRNIVE